MTTPQAKRSPPPLEEGASSSAPKRLKQEPSTDQALLSSSTDKVASTSNSGGGSSSSLLTELTDVLAEIKSTPSSGEISAVVLETFKHLMLRIEHLSADGSNAEAAQVKHESERCLESWFDELLARCEADGELDLDTLEEELAAADSDDDEDIEAAMALALALQNNHDVQQQDDDDDEEDQVVVVDDDEDDIEAKSPVQVTAWSCYHLFSFRFFIFATFALSFSHFPLLCVNNVFSLSLALVLLADKRFARFFFVCLTDPVDARFISSSNISRFIFFFSTISTSLLFPHNFFPNINDK